MDGELVDWDKATRPRPHPLASTTASGCSRASVPTHDRGVARGVPADRPHRRLFTSAQGLHDRHPLHRRGARRGGARRWCASNGLDDGCYIRPLVYLGYGEMGLNPLPCPVARVHRGVAVGHLPRRRGRGQRHPAEGQLRGSATTPTRCRPRPRATGMYINSSLAKVEAAEGRLRRGGPARARRLRRRSARARTSSSSADGPSSPRRRRTSGALDGITQDSVRDHRHATSATRS